MRDVEGGVIGTVPLSPAGLWQILANPLYSLVGTGTWQGFNDIHRKLNLFVLILFVSLDVGAHRDRCRNLGVWRGARRALRSRREGGVGSAARRLALGKAHK